MEDETRVYQYERMAATIAHLIETGTFRPGSRIPSVRQLSQQKKVSITTVLQAYYLLEARGLIEARPHSGFFVRTSLPTTFPEPDISSPEADPASVSVWELVTRVVLRDALNPNLVPWGAAHPNPELLATKKLNRLLALTARQMGNQGSLYDLPPGCEALRLQIARRAVAAGCDLAPADIVTTSGCAEAISLCLRAICRPGDTVAVESPICFDVLQCLEVIGLKALEIPTHPRDGISLEALRFAIDQTPVRACLVISNFNNPLGSCIPDDHKKELVELLASHDIPLIENNIFGEIYFTERRPSVAKAYDRKGLVMLCSSFSKDLCPGYRVGWVAPGQFKPTIEWLKYTSSLATVTLPQLAVAEFLASGGYDHHLRHIRRVYASHIGAMSQAVMRCFPPGTRVTRPAGGFVLWIQLPETVDSLELYRLALKAGIAITPGHIFSATQKYHNFIRLNAANWSDQAEPAMRRLGDLIFQLTG